MRDDTRRRGFRCLDLQIGEKVIAQNKSLNDSSDKRTDILLFTNFYLPGHRGGGPIRSISNMVEQLGSEYGFFVVTGDRDLGDDVKYASIVPDEWLDVGNARVIYLSPERQSLRSFAELAKSFSGNVLYLNSVFNYRFGILPLVAMRLGLFPKFDVVVAPRGEFSAGALAQKSLKKKIFLLLAKSVGIYSNVVWHASTADERDDICRTIGSRDDGVVIARNITKKRSASKMRERSEAAGREPHASQVVRICFLSRITPKKNLDFALRVLGSVNVPVEFGIYGPVESEEHWALCKALMEAMPEHVAVEYHGDVENSRVEDVMSTYDMFFLPTLGENYGHVFVEAFAAGAVVLVSDQTPWRNLKELNVGWDISLDKPDGFKSAIEEYSSYDLHARNAMRKSCLALAAKESDAADALAANRLLFDTARGKNLLLNPTH
jgi:glycosyltransferase involved in cell wall biosynthesis